MRRISCFGSVEHQESVVEWNDETKNKVTSSDLLLLFIFMLCVCVLVRFSSNLRELYACSTKIKYIMLYRVGYMGVCIESIKSAVPFATKCIFSLSFSLLHSSSPSRRQRINFIDSKLFCLNLRNSIGLNAF